MAALRETKRKEIELMESMNQKRSLEFKIKLDEFERELKFNDVERQKKIRRLKEEQARRK